MKRLLLAATVAVLAIAALSTAGADARGAKVKHCQNTYFAPQYLKIKKISAQGAGCSAARGLSLAYMRAVTSSSGAHAHLGHCFGASSYGHCTVAQKGRKWGCFHFDPTETKHPGLVRCTSGKAVIKFNITF